MKRIILIALLCMALFALPALATEACEHASIRCTGACEDCGTTGLTTDNPLHCLGYYETNDTQCWAICGDCGDADSAQDHQTYCFMNGVCMYCQTTPATITVLHSNALNYAYDSFEHWGCCSDCGEEMPSTRYAHTVSCDVPDTCTVCGATDCTGNATHGNSIWAYDDAQCWKICEYCGAQMTEKQEHQAICPDNGKCSNCGTSISSDPVHWVTNGGVYGYNETQHWLICEGCGELLDIMDHSVSCADPGVCTECGASGCTNDVTHAGAFEIVYDEAKHWEACSVCEAVRWEGGEHYNVCISGLPLGRCVECDYDQVTTFYHIQDGGTVGEPPETTTQYSETEHWETCNGCNAELSDTRESHTVSCTNPGVCTECGASGCTNDMTHVGSSDDVWYTDSTTHWQLCACGEKLSEGAHDNCGGNCSTCGMAVTHAYDYDAPEYDEASHWFTCLNGCGETLTFGHYNFCSDTEHCAVCGADYAGDWSHNPDWDNIEHDDTYCWMYCADCNIPCAKEEHSQVCTDPGVCGRCGTEVGDDVFMYHFLTEETQVTGDGTHHWWPCEECGEQTDKYAHTVSCATPGVCTICGLACDETLEISHNYDYETFLHDADYCWVECVDCGAVTSKFTHSGDGEWLYDETHHWAYCIRCYEIDGKYEHGVFCTTPGECTACGYEMGDDAEVGHYRYADTPYEYDEASHWFTCVMCSEPAFKGEHAFEETERDESKVVYTCGCGATREEDLHPVCSFVESSRVEATCGAAGEIVYTCECGETKTEEILALEHSYTTTETPATCEDDGKKVTTCGRCGDETVEVLPAIGHDYDITSLRKPTCTSKGIKEVTCEHCGDEIVSYIDATGHACSETVTEATCDTDGAKTIVCANCGDEQTEVIPAVGHSYGMYVTKGDGTHTAECSVCGDVRVRDCNYKDVTTNGITLTSCTVCGHTYYGHLPVVTVEAETETEASTEAETEAVADTLFTPARVTGAVAKSAATQEDVGAQLVVYDQAGTLQEDSPILAMYTICLESDGYAVQPEEALTIELPLTETQTAEDFAGYKLFCIDSTGALVEIEYTIEEGVIVFETTLVGIFVFLPADTVAEG